MRRLEQRWQRRWQRLSQEASQGAVRTFRIQEAMKLRQAPEQVWALILPAENAVGLMPDDVARGFKAPDTPAGLGEQQCFVDVEGIWSVYEIVEYVEARRAVMQLIFPLTPASLRTTHQVEPVGEGSILSFGMEFDAPEETIWPQEQQTEWRRKASRYLERVRHTLATEASAGLLND